MQNNISVNNRENFTVDLGAKLEVFQEGVLSVKSSSWEHVLSQIFRFIFGPLSEFSDDHRLSRASDLLGRVKEFESHFKKNDNGTTTFTVQENNRKITALLDSTQSARVFESLDLLKKDLRVAYAQITDLSRSQVSVAKDETLFRMSMSLLPQGELLASQNRISNLFAEASRETGKSYDPKTAVSQKFISSIWEKFSELDSVASFASSSTTPETRVSSIPGQFSTGAGLAYAKAFIKEKRGLGL